MTYNDIFNIDEVISHCYDFYFEKKDESTECRKEYKQIARWLEELKADRKIINRQEAEIEILHTKNSELRMALKVIKRETIKKFAEKVKQTVLDNTYPYFDKEGKPVCIFEANGYKEIDNLVKEMTEM